MSAGDVIAIGQTIIGLIRLIDETHAVAKECRDLKARCEVVKKILDDNQSVLKDGDGLKSLKDAVEEGTKYLESRKKRWFVRNPVFEKMFFFRIARCEKSLDSWVTTVNLSLTVMNLLEVG
jgi:hypothetical protein